MVLMGCMNKSHFASYKFKPSDVIEGLNRYFAESKVYRYLRVPLEIKNGEVNPGNYYLIRNIVFDVSTPKIKESGYYYLICDPEEVVGVAINWLREEHDIFYTPGMNEPPIKDPDDIFSMENLKETKNFSVTIDYFCVDDAAKEYEKATRKDNPPIKDHDDIDDFVKWYSEEDLREALGIAEDSDIFQCIKYRNHQLEILRTEVAVARRRYNRANNDRSYLGKRLVDIRKAAGMADDDPTDLVKYVEQLREANEELANHRVAEGWLRKDNSDLAIKVSNLEEQLRVLRYDILKVYREIFDCSNGDPEGTDEETLQDILTEYKRTLELKDDAETDNAKWRPYIADILGMDKGSDWSDICIRARVIRHDRDNLDLCLKMLEKHIKEAYSEVFQADADKHWFGHGCQAVTDIVEALKRERAIKEEAEEKAVKYKRMAQKLNEIQDICER